MSSEILFTSIEYNKYDAIVTLPAKFERLIDDKILVDKLKSYEAKVYITDNVVSGARDRGYTEEFLGVPIIPVCGVMNKYYYEKEVNFKTFKNVDIGGNIHDADVMIDFSHVKGHGACGYGGACKNIAMGCVTDRTRR